MTVGHRIQHYRKLQGLSQEELGQKLLVSRQTVSLWENDQTLPTIDNLVRLKDIFGVSIDEILTEQPEKQTNPDAQPLESYVFTPTVQELEGVRKTVKRLMIRRNFLWVFVCWVVFTVLAGGTGWFGNAILYGMIYVVMTAIAIFRHKKEWQKNNLKLPQRLYFYDVYENHIFQRIQQNGQLEQSCNIPLSELQFFSETKQMFSVRHDGKLLNFPTSQLQPNSRLYQLRQRKSRASGKLCTAAQAALVASVIAAVAAVVWFFYLSWDMELLIRRSWYAFLLLPIPVAAIILGIVLKVKGEKWVKNLVAGVIAAALLSLCGSMSIIFADFNGSILDAPPNPPYIGTIERYTGIDIPEHSSVHTLDFGDQAYTSGWTTTYISSTIFFDEQAVVEFERDMQTDSRWQLNFKNELAGVMPNVYTEGRYVLVYNIDLDQWNQVPPESGDYRMLILLYDIEGNTMNAMEYILHYTK